MKGLYNIVFRDAQTIYDDSLMNAERNGTTPITWAQAVKKAGSDDPGIAFLDAIEKYQAERPQTNFDDAFQAVTIKQPALYSAYLNAYEMGTLKQNTGSYAVLDDREAKREQEDLKEINDAKQMLVDKANENRNGATLDEALDRAIEENPGLARKAGLKE